MRRERQKQELVLASNSFSNSWFDWMRPANILKLRNGSYKTWRDNESLSVDISGKRIQNRRTDGENSGALWVYQLTTPSREFSWRFSTWLLDIYRIFVVCVNKNHNHNNLFIAYWIFDWKSQILVPCSIIWACNHKILEKKLDSNRPMRRRNRLIIIFNGPDRSGTTISLDKREKKSRRGKVGNDPLNNPHIDIS